MAVCTDAKLDTEIYHAFLYMLRFFYYNFCLYGRDGSWTQTLDLEMTGECFTIVLATIHSELGVLH